MIPRKFVAATSREALYKVRESLGDEAIILSNKQVPGGVEIIAVSEHEMDVFAHEADAQPTWQERRSASAPTQASKSASSPVYAAQAAEWSPYADDEPPIGAGAAAARYQHWQNVSSWMPPQYEAEEQEPISTLNDYWHTAPVIPTNAGAPASHIPSHLPQYSSQHTSHMSHAAHANGMAAASPVAQRVAPSHMAHPPHPPHSSSPSAMPASVAPAAQRSSHKASAPLPKPPAQKRNPPSATAPVRQPEPSSARPAASAPSSLNRSANTSHSQHTHHGAAQEEDNHPAIQHELKLLRSMLEGQLAGLAWNEMAHRTPLHQTLMRWMLSAGMSPELSRALMASLQPTHDIMAAMNQIKQMLAQRIRCMAPAEDIIDQGGIYALVGTTGVGKTTTVAKLAARCTLKHGPQHVALLTTDSYRIGAHDQLKAYGRILSVPVYAIRDESDLVSALNDLSTRRLILIDTIGMSQRDRRLVEQVALLGRQGVKVQQLLLIAANAQASTLEDIVRAYGASQLSGVIISKLDEACQIGSVLDVLIRHQLRLCYVADGQRVPEDVHLPHARMLIDRAFQDVVAHSALSLNEDEYPLVWK